MKSLAQDAKPVVRLRDLHKGEGSVVVRVESQKRGTFGFCDESVVSAEMEVCVDGRTLGVDWSKWAETR